MKHIQKRWRKRESRRKNGERKGLKGCAAYLRNLAAVVALAIWFFLAAVVQIPIFLVVWLARRLQWIVAAAVGAGIIAVWIWRSCTEKF